MTGAAALFRSGGAADVGVALERGVGVIQRPAILSHRGEFLRALDHSKMIYFYFFLSGALFSLTRMRNPDSSSLTRRVEFQ
jgi:hypothetical protein